MAVTPEYGFVMPDPTDFVTDLPADFEIFGDAVDAQLKALNPGTTAGDLDYYTSSTAKSRLGIGTAGQVLKVNSGATAPEWGTVSAGGGSFTLLNAGGTSLSGNNTVTVSGIDKEKLLIFITGTRMTNASSAITVRFNSDTGTNYARVFTRTTAANTYAATNFATTGNINATSFQVLTSSSNADSVCEFSLSLIGGKSTGGKAVTYVGGADASGGTGQILVAGQGVYLASAAVTSVSVISAGGNFTLGTLYVYGSDN